MGRSTKRKVPPMPQGGEAYGAWFDAEAADRAVAAFPAYLCHTEAEWAGQPFHLADWQRDRVVRPLFGWKRADGTRLIRTVLLVLPRKNGKTEFAAGTAVLVPLIDGEMGGQIYSMAADEDQAKILFNKAGIMIGYSGVLRSEFEVYKKSIFCPRFMSRIQPLSSRPDTKHGFSPTAAIADEIHVWPDGELYQVVHDGMAARRQPIEILITTAGIYGQGFGWEMYEYAKKVEEGTIEDPTFLPVIYEAAADDDWTDEAVWAKVNPNYGVSVKPDFLRQQCAKAKESPRHENNFRRYHLNQWTEQAERWISMEKWDACPDASLDLASLAGRPGWAGLDLSTTTDITALALMFEAPSDAAWEWDLWCHFWMPAAGLAERVRRDRVPYHKWAADGFITLTEGDVIDYDVIRGRITGAGDLAPADGVVCDYVPIEELAIDRWNAAHITTQLQGDGLTVVPFGQGMASMSAASKEFEALILRGVINHMGNPVLRWMVSGAEIQSDAAGNIKPVKPDRRKSVQRIDGVVASIMATGRAVVNTGPAPASPYDTDENYKLAVI